MFFQKSILKKKVYVVAYLEFSYLKELTEVKIS